MYLMSAMDMRRSSQRAARKGRAVKGSLIPVMIPAAIKRPVKAYLYGTDFTR